MPITYAHSYAVTLLNGIYQIDSTVDVGSATISDLTASSVLDNTSLLGDVVAEEYLTTQGGANTQGIYIGKTSDGFIGQVGLGNLFLYTNTAYAFNQPVSGFLAADPTNPTTVTILCFCAGTLIRTTTGEVAVESLDIGDVLVTAEGETRPVTWIGRQSVVSLFADPVRGWPVRIAAGAVAEGVPARDLSVSPDHALFIDGIFVQAGALVNGTTIRRIDHPAERFTYFHVETEDHAVILAEGMPVESFVDNVSRRRFDNYAEYEALFGREADQAAMRERDEPRAMSARQVPAAIKARIAARAAILAPAEAAA